jgi:hypothetical protein
VKPNFEAMSNAELKAYALAHRDDVEPLRVLSSRRTPDSESTLFHPPKTEAEWQQQLNTIASILEQDRAKETN